MFAAGIKEDKLGKKEANPGPPEGALKPPPPPAPPNKRVIIERKGAIMTKADILKRLESMDDDKVIVFIDGNGGWSNIETLIEKDCQIEMTIEKAPLFSDN